MGFVGAPWRLACVALSGHPGGSELWQVVAQIEPPKRHALHHPQGQVCGDGAPLAPPRRGSDERVECSRGGRWEVGRVKVAGLVQFFSGLVQFHEVGLVKVAGLVQFFRKQEGGIVGHVWDRFGSNGRFVDPQAPGRSACCRASASRRSKVIPWKSCWAQADAKLFRTNPLSGVGLKEGQTDPIWLAAPFFCPLP